MLVLLMGVYGVGKSTLIRKLSSHPRVRIINTYVTRNLRPNEFEKISVNKSIFEQWIKDGLFLSVNIHIGEYYGIKKDDIIKACADPNIIYIIDFPISKEIVFEDYQYKRIIILFESIEQLYKQLVGGGREERYHLALKDFEDNYKRLENEYKNKINTLIVVNEYGKETKIFENVKRYLKLE